MTSFINIVGSHSSEVPNVVLSVVPSVVPGIVVSGVVRWVGIYTQNGNSKMLLTCVPSLNMIKHLKNQMILTLILKNFHKLFDN